MADFGGGAHGSCPPPPPPRKKGERRTKKGGKEERKGQGGWMGGSLCLALGAGRAQGRCSVIAKNSYNQIL